MGIDIALSASILCLFSAIVINIFNEVENIIFRSAMVVLFICSGITIPVSLIASIWI